MFTRLRLVTKLSNKFLKYTIAGGLGIYATYLLIKNNNSVQSLLTEICPGSVLYIPNTSKHAIESAIRSDPEVLFQIPKSEITEEICKTFVSWHPKRFNDIPVEFKTCIAVQVSMWKSLIHEHSNINDLPESHLTSEILSTMLKDNNLPESYLLIEIKRLIADQQLNTKPFQNNNDLLDYLQNNDIFKGISLWLNGFLLTHKYPDTFDGLLLTGSQFNEYYKYIDLKYDHDLELGLNLGPVKLKQCGCFDKLGNFCLEHDKDNYYVRSILIPNNALVKINKNEIEIDKIILGPIESQRPIDKISYE